MRREKSETPQYALMIHEESRNGYYHIKGNVIEVSSKHETGYRYTWGDASYQDLQVSGTGYDRRRDPGMSHWETEYQQPFSVDLSKAEAMCKTLKTLRRKLDDYAAIDGAIDTYGRYVLRVCRALNIDWMATYTQHDGLTVFPVERGMRKINAMIQAWQVTEDAPTD